nr:DUF87 domain-containing protein [Escherichia coli]
MIIGQSPLANNANVAVDPDRLFGRHIAVLGNTGSGKSCSVAGLIQWSLEAAMESEIKPNARFIILDPNGEYTRALGPTTKFKGRVFKVEAEDGETNYRYLHGFGIVQNGHHSRKQVLKHNFHY